MSNAVTTVPAHQVSDMERMAKAFAASKLFGVQNADQALALMLVAQAEGRHPASAAQDYNIIQGRPAKKADAMLRDFLSAGGKVEWHTLNDEKADATFSHPAGGSARIDWTLKRAQAAGISNPMWKKYPRQMLRSRAVSEGVRTVCPGATRRGRCCEINTLTKEGLADWLANFDDYTADQPISWLDPYRDKLELRRQELFAPHLEAEADMDAAFAGAVGRAA